MNVKTLKNEIQLELELNALAQPAVDAARNANAAAGAASNAAARANAILNDIDAAKDNLVTEIAEAAQEQQEEIRRVGEQTLASIPEDYTALAGDVSSLKDQKVDVAQGVENYGKYMYVDADGNVTPGTAPAGGNVTGEDIQNAVDDFLERNPVQAGATEEQAAQIEANRQAIEEVSGLIEETGTQSSGTQSLSVGANQEGATDAPLCIAVGAHNLKNATGAKNIVIGFDSMQDATGSRNTAVGYHAGYRMTSGQDNTHVGAESGDDGMTGAQNTSVGAHALKRNAKGNNNTCVGFKALNGNPDTFDEGKTYTGNTVAGAKAGQKLTSGDYNVIVGADTMSNTPSGSQNTAVGTAALNTSTAVNNCVALGFGAGKQADGNNQFWVANNGSADKDHALMYGVFAYTNLAAQFLVINGLLYLPHIPTSDPGAVGAVWNDNGTLKISSGA